MPSETGTNSADGWPVILLEMAQVVEAHLLTAPKMDARRQALRIVATLAHYFGGRQIYMPRVRRQRRTGSG